MAQVIGVVAGLLGIASLFCQVAVVIHRRASRPKGMAVVLTGMSLVSLLTLLTLFVVLGVFLVR